MERFDIDWADELGSDTITALTVEESGVASVDSFNGSVTSHTVSGAGGYLTVRVQTDAGETHVARLRFIAKNRKRVSDYGYYG